MPEPVANPPREPDIEFLGRMARRFLWVLRRVFWLAGAFGVGNGIWVSLGFGTMAFAVPDPDGAVPAVGGVVWICAGLPLLLPVDWLFGRGWSLMLMLGCGLWFGASLLPDEPQYGYILRFFASLVACATMIVWRTLWRLTKNA